MINYMNAFNNWATNGATPPINVKTAIAIDIPNSSLCKKLIFLIFIIIQNNERDWNM